MCKTRTMAAMLATVMMAGVAQAGLILEITQNPDPASGLESFTVTAIGTEGEVVATIGNLALVGDVHQVWPLGGTRTAVPEELSGGLWDSAWDQYDTHLLIPESDILTMQATLMETNDGADPAGLNLVGPFGPTSNPTVGLGMLTMDMTNGDAGLALMPDAQQARVDLLQVVIPKGSSENVKINVMLLGSQSLDAGVAFHDIPLLAIPEPGSLAGLLIGTGVFALQRRRRVA